MRQRGDEITQAGSRPGASSFSEAQSPHLQNQDKSSPVLLVLSGNCHVKMYVKCSKSHQELRTWLIARIRA